MRLAGRVLLRRQRRGGIGTEVGGRKKEEREIVEGEEQARQMDKLCDRFMFRKLSLVAHILFFPFSVLFSIFSLTPSPYICRKSTAHIAHCSIHGKLYDVALSLSP